MGRDVSIKSILQGIIGARRWELIENWRRQWWRLWSIRLQAIGLFLLAWGNLPLELWGMMPAELRRMLPGGTATILSSAFFAAAMIARFVKQKKLIDDLAR